MPISRRTFLATSVATGAALTAAGCSKSSSGGSTTTIRYEFWGTPKKAALINAAIAAFEKKYPTIKVKVETSPWAGYWDKIATETAGGNAPEVIHMSERYIREYGDRNALAELDNLDGLDLGDLNQQLLGLGKSGDKLYAVAAGLNTLTPCINRSLFERQGVKVPDDKTWTWQEFYATSKAVAKNGIYGADYGAGIETLRPWLRQAGVDIYSEDGKGVGYTPDQLKTYLEHLMTIRNSGAPSPDQTAENASLPLAAQPFSVGKQAMSWAYSNQLVEFAGASKDTYNLMLFPSHDGQAKHNGMYYKGSEFYSISAKASGAKKDAAAKFVNFMVNDPEAVKAVGLSMGVPPNTKLVDALRPSLDKLNTGVADFISNLQQYLSMPSPGPSPKGAGNVDGDISGNCMEMLSGRMAIDAADSKITDAIKRDLNA